MKFLLTVVLLFTLTDSSIAYSKENNIKELKEQIKEMVKELESNTPENIKKFLLKYSTLGMRGKAPSVESMDRIVKTFINEKQQPLLSVLVSIQKEDPTYNSESKKYIYKGILGGKLIFNYSKSKEIFHLRN